MSNPLKLSDIITSDLFGSKFKDIRQHVVANSVQRFRKYRSNSLPSVSLFMWDEMCNRGLVQEPFSIRPILNKNYRGIYEFVWANLRHPPIVDAYGVEFFNEINSTTPFAQLEVVQCFPNDIHICDVKLEDNRRPLPSGHPDLDFRENHGLHVFGELLIRLKEVAKSREVERISLMVAFPPLHNVFLKHGFRVNNTPNAQIAYESVGTGHAMILEV